jgi:hypothetical protein
MPRSNGAEVIEKKIIMETVTQGLAEVYVPQAHQDGILSPDTAEDPPWINYGRQTIPG